MINAAIVVAYFPDKNLLSRLLNLIGNQVNNVYIIDNTPVKNIDWLGLDWLASSGFDVEYVPLGDNLGIAKAQNIGIELAIKDNCDHVIFFDQDSAPSIGMINNLAKAESRLLKNGFLVGSVGPLFLDEKTNEYAPAIRHVGFMVKRFKVEPGESFPVMADYLISSGSLIQVSVLKEIGVMKEELFIDWVDVEWGLRAGNSCYCNFIVPDAIMLHSVGDGVTSIGNRKINLHSDIRNYYIVRNACHLLLTNKIKWQWRVNILLKIPVYVIFYSIKTLSKKRGRSFINLIGACFDGFLGRLGKAS